MDFKKFNPVWVDRRKGMDDKDKILVFKVKSINSSLLDNLKELERKGYIVNISNLLNEFVESVTG